LDLIEGFEADGELESCECNCNLRLVVLIAVFFRVFLVWWVKILLRMDLEGSALAIDKIKGSALSVSGGQAVNDWLETP
jgi:hypothetical protein